MSSGNVLDFRCVVQVEPMGFADGWGVRYLETERGVGDESKEFG